MEHLDKQHFCICMHRPLKSWWRQYTPLDLGNCLVDCYNPDIQTPGIFILHLTIHMDILSSKWKILGHIDSPLKWSCVSHFYWPNGNKKYRKKLMLGHKNL